MDETDDMAVAEVPTTGHHASEALFGGLGLSWTTFDEYETPFDPLAAIDGD